MMSIGGVSKQLRLSWQVASACQAAEHLEENPLELLAKDAVDDEVNRTVDGDKKVVCLCERMVHAAKMLK